MLKNILKNAIVLQLALGSAAALANTYNFTGLSISQQDISGQLSVDVTDAGSSVLFKIKNAVGTASNVSEIYFDTNTGTTVNSFFSNILILSESGTSSGSTTAVDFSTGANPSDLPGGGTFVSDYAFDIYNSNTAGLNEFNDFIIFSGSLSVGSTYLDVINALNNNVFEIGLHVRSIPGVNGGRSDSDSYITGGPSAVPLPAAGWLFGSALLGLMGLSRRKL